jgi:hypothetical protein
MGKKYTYETILIKGPFKGTYAEFPFNSVKEFGTRKHVWCKVTVEGKTYSMNLLPNGNGGHWLHLKKDIRIAIGKQEGDSAKIILEKHNTPREVPVPEYLQWLLDDDPIIKKYFEKLPISGRKFWIGFIDEPKNDDTKVERINRLFDFLRQHYSDKK